MILKSGPIGQWHQMASMELLEEDKLDALDSKRYHVGSVLGPLDRRM